MEHYARAAVAQFEGSESTRLARLREAFELERKAADQAHTHSAPEPSRSIYHRGAAALAIDIGEHNEARRLIGQARLGDPPAYVKSDLDEMEDRISFIG
ncbi:MAG: hypothetical protein U0Q16_34060 [Bryobacteraceae bacterium]